MMAEAHAHHHEHHHHDHGEYEHHHHEDGEDCTCGCHDHEHEHHEHHHHDHDEHEHHHHEHDEDCTCGCHDHDHDHHGHHHHHDADEVFGSWGEETAHKFTREKLAEILEALNDTERFGMVVRAKGIVDGGNEWLHFDFTPGEADIRAGSAEVTGRVCVIGAELNNAAVRELFLGA